MNAQDLKLLQEIVETPSPSGFEQPVQRILRRELEGVAAAVRSDILGNLCIRLPGGAEAGLRVMLAAHCDEIGFMVRYIDDNGFLWFAPVGGVDPHLVPGQRVTIHGALGAVAGVIGRKPIHLIEAKERETVARFKQLFIDIGAPNRGAAESRVGVGDCVTFDAGFSRLGESLATSRAFDDKAGVFVLTRVLQGLAAKAPLAAEIWGVSTVQEEIGLRGAATSAFELRPDIAIIIEVGFASDVPDADKKEQGEVKLGAGPLLSRGPNINPALFDAIVATAAAEKIPVQIVAEPRATGTDANVVQLSRGGVATALVRVPLRYMHTPSEVLSLDDVDAVIRLVVALVGRLPSRRELVPA